MKRRRLAECTIVRAHSDRVNTRGFGFLQIDDEIVMHFFTLELAWRENKRKVSCIPPRAYVCKRHRSPRFGDCWKVFESHGGEVSGRSEILIHPANYASSDPNYKSDLQGCIAFGSAFADLNNDGVLEIVNSRETHRRFDLNLTDFQTFNLTIKNAF